MEIKEIKLLEYSKQEERNWLVNKLMKSMYPDYKPGPGSLLPKYTLDEVALTDCYSTITPSEADLSVSCGNVNLAAPLLVAPMDTVAGAELGKAAFELGMACIIYRHKKMETQLQWIEEVLRHRPCLVQKPQILGPNATLEDAADILSKYKYSTIPIVSDNGQLIGILFTKDASFKENADDLVCKWMTPFKQLKRVQNQVSFAEARQRLLTESGCSVLPVVDNKRNFCGIYFRKDCRPAKPMYYNDHPVVGMAVGVKTADIQRVQEGLKLGVSIIVIDSSHGNGPEVIKQAAQIVALAKPYGAAVIAGNVASIDGYLRFAAVGVDAVKVGIGSGSICTTSLATGVGVPMWSLIRECVFAREDLIKEATHAPIIIADGGINNTGQMVKALAAGAHLCMAGKFFAAAQESLAAIASRARAGDLVPYRGMASPGAIRDRSAMVRYGAGKQAPEGVEGLIECRGSLKSWWPEDRELICGGLAHVGAATVSDLQMAGNQPYIWSLLSAAGQHQMETRVLLK